jgi:hypothetical protein
MRSVPQYSLSIIICAAWVCVRKREREIDSPHLAFMVNLGCEYLRNATFQFCEVIHPLDAEGERQLLVRGSC